jgi:hypothetical protein
MKVGVPGSGRPIAVLTALTAALVLSLSVLAATAGAELITPHAATPETVTPHEVTPAPEAASEPVPAPEVEPEYSESEESGESEESQAGEAPQPPKLHPHQTDPFPEPPPETGPGDSGGGITRYWWDDHYWQFGTCGLECKLDWLWFANRSATQSMPGYENDGSGDEWYTPEGSLLYAVLSRVEGTYMKNDLSLGIIQDIKDLATALNQPPVPEEPNINHSADVPKGDQSKADAPVDNPFEGNQDPAKGQCRGQGNTSDTNDQVEDGKSGSNVCR